MPESRTRRGIRARPVAYGPRPEAAIRGFLTIRFSKHGKMIHIRGESMSPILANGDIVAIDHAEAPRSLADLKRLDGKMVASRIHGGVTIKWLK